MTKTKKMLVWSALLMWLGTMFMEIGVFFQQTNWIIYGVLNFCTGLFVSLLI